METTREKIVKKSAELFNTYGYHACSLSHIMEATGLKKGGIYNHFKNKDEIAVEAFNYNYERVQARFKERLSQVNTPTEKIIAVIDAFVSFIDDPIVQGGGCPIFNTAMDATNTHPMLKEKAKAGIDGLKKYVEYKLLEGIEAGEFNEGINVKKVSSLMVATLEGAIVMSRVEDSNDCLEMASEYVKEYLFKNIIKS
ncbi:TetR/AcrR family transcriptional regulator [Fulvivirga lutea]|uniref:TetR/AcrR family transcriptional regulator n=1 Tax=Fulvivirga lutea TaxID=2810512 RepID=A0A974WGM9_9BACT|nr:TetR/AcrR family transcriptional regulator [Fulvivirga lutea]QSE97710.1 TetR/AcrR family transcriptional regulator [Fulvivirga lutea]